MTKDGLALKKRRKPQLSAYLILGAILTVAMAAFPVILSVQAEGTSAKNAASAVLAPCTPVTFTNSTAISVSTGAPAAANPYPSSVNVAGLPGNVVTTAGGVEVTLNGVSHTWPDDLAIVLVGPTGAALLLQDGAGDGTDLVNLTYKISDLGANALPNAGAWAPGTYRPTSYYEPSNFPAPGPGSNYQVPANAGTATLASVFGNTAPNGTWSLFVRDFGDGDGGQFAGGWTLTLTTEGCNGTGTPTPSPTQTATPTPSPSPTTTPPGGAVTFTGTNFGSIPDDDCNGPGRQIFIEVSGVTGPISNIRVSFTGTHTWVGDVDVQLIAPGGAASQDIFTYTGNLGNNAEDDFGDNSELNGTYNFFDTAPNNWWAAAEATDSTSAIPPGDYRASDVTGQNVPLDPVFANLGNPNGTWILQFNDCASSFVGEITAASLTLTGSPTVQFSSAAYIDDESQSAVITIVRTGDNTGVSTVQFSTVAGGTAQEGLDCTVPGVDFPSIVDQTVTFAAGQTTAQVVIPLCSDVFFEPTETVNLAISNPSGGTSLGAQTTAVLSINDTASQHRNTTPINILEDTMAVPYPSNITVTGSPDNVFRIRVTLYDLSHTIPENIDVLLVSPNGVRFILMAGAGGSIPIPPGAPVTLTFEDSAGPVLPDATLLTTGKYEPTSWETPILSFPTPAPPAPYVEPGSELDGPTQTTLFGNFAGVSANGTWSLYVRDQDGVPAPGAPTPQVGQIAGGWGIEFVAATSSGVEVSGRVLTPDGQGLRNARVSMVDSKGVERTVLTGSLGYYSFDEVDMGEAYVIGVASRRYRFESRLVQVFDSLTDVDFVGIE